VDDTLEFVIRDCTEKRTFCLRHMRQQQAPAADGEMAAALKSAC